MDVSQLQQPWPEWLRTTIERLAKKNGWAEDWFNDGVVFHLSALADPAEDHLEFGTFPPEPEEPGLLVYVPSAPYLLALKLKAMRVNDPVRGDQERPDVLMRVVGISTTDQAISLLTRFFPNSGAAAEKQKFLLKYMNPDGAVDAPQYPRRGD